MITVQPSIAATSDGVARGLRELRTGHSPNVVEVQLVPAGFTALLGEKIAFSMDGKGHWRDNVFVERPSRPVRYRENCLNAIVSAPDTDIGRFIGFYNAVRPRFVLGGRACNLFYLHEPFFAAA